MRINYLDSLRGIAALMVVIYHANCWLDFTKDKVIQSAIPSHVLNIFFSGNTAVALFFVLSGFVLSFKYVNKTRDAPIKLHLIEFLIKRIFRIYPAFWVVLAIIYVIFGGKPLTFLQEGSLLFNQYETIHFVPIDWTLIIEAKMSILMPVFIVLCYFGYRYVIFFALILFIFFNIDNNVVHFIIGIGIALNFNIFTAENWQNSKLYAYRYWIYALILLLLSADSLYFIIINHINLHESNTNLGFVAKGIASGMIIMLVICSPKIQLFLENKALLFLGKISYGIYIGHWFICVNIIETMYFESMQSVIGSFYLTHIIVRYGLWTIVSILFGAILYYGIEQPAIKLGSYLITKLRKTRYWNYF